MGTCVSAGVVALSRCASFAIPVVVLAAPALKREPDGFAVFCATRPGAKISNAAVKSTETSA